MGSAGKSRGHTKQDMEEDIDADYDRAKDDEEWGGSEKRKHKSTRSKKSGSGEEENDLDGSGRWESSREGNDGRRRSVESIKVGSDEDDYDSRKESYTKQVKKKQEESTLEKLSHWYQDGEFDNKVDGRDKSMGRGHDLFDESERNSSRKSSKIIDHEASRSRSKSKEDRSYDGDYDKSMDQDHKHSERRESNRELDHGSLEQGRSSRKRWDDADVGNKNEESSLTEKSESRSGKILESKSESSRERNTSLKLETREVKGRISESSKGRGKSYDREDIRVDVDGMKSRSRSIAAEEENRAGSPPRGDIPDQERSERHRDNRHTGSDESQERSSYPEDGSNLKRDKGDREAGHSRRSRTPDKRRYNHESLKSEIDYEWNSSLKRKELDKEVYMDDKVKTKDESLTDKNRDREGSRESWKRRQTVSSDKDVDSSYDRDKDWDLPRRGRDRMDNDRPSGRSGNRKDSRGEAVKASSNFGISTENYDVIEIQTKPLDYGRGDLATAFARRDEGSQSDLKTVSNDPQVDLTKTGVHLSVSASNASKDKYMDEGAMLQDQNAWRDDADSQGGRKGQKVTLPARASGSQTSSSSSQPPYGNQESGFSGGRPFQPGGKGGRLGRHSRVRPSGRDNQQVNVHVPLMSPFGPLSMPPPGPIQSLNPNMSPAPGPGMPPGVFIPPFSPPVWPGARAVDLSLLPVSPGMSPLPPGPAGQRFGPNIGTPPNPVMFYNQPGPGRGVPANVSGSGFSAMVPSGRGQSHDKVSGGWVHPKSNAPPGKAPSRGEQNDYSQNFVDTGMRPQNFIRELELTNVEDYPKLRELIQKKDEIVAKASTPPVYYKCDLREFVLSPEFFGTKFDVILIDPPWEEYVHRAAGVADHMESWTFEDIMNLKIEAIADTPSFIFLWVGDGVGLEQGRQCLKKWGFRRCEDICWVKTNKNTATPSLRHDSNTLFQHSKEHCLMGIKGTVRRSTDGHIIHANIDTDVIIAEEPPYGSTQKPDEIYRIIEHFALGRRRLELFGEDHNIRPGWLTVGKGLSSSNFNAEVYMKNFCDKDGKVWQGGGGRNPPPDAPHLVLTTPEIEALRPKSPMKNQQQLQQQSSSISLTAANSSNRKATGNSPQTPNPFGLNQEAASSEHLAPWVQMEGLRGREIGNLGPHDSVLDIYGYNMPPPMLPNGEFLDYETPRSMNML